MIINTIESVLARVDRSGECWEWLGGKVDGYGSVSFCGSRKRVHRLIYEHIVGDIPEGLFLDHLCRNRACCNPDHLDLVTNAENLRRSPIIGLNNGLAIRTRCANGHEYTPENTGTQANGSRRCRECACIASAKNRARVGSRPWFCAVCDKDVTASQKSRHIKTSGHLDKLIDADEAGAAK